MPDPKPAGGSISLAEAKRQAKERARNEAAEPGAGEPGGGGRAPGMGEHGLVRQTDNGPVRICARFELLAETRDDDAQSWGLLLGFDDRDGAPQRVIVTRDLFAGEGGELRSLLARRGLYLNPSPSARAILNEYLSKLTTPNRARVVARTGWHDIDGVRVFVLPNETFGEAGVGVVYDANLREPSPFGSGGELDAWRDEVAARCAGNSRLVLAVSCAFAAPLIGLIGEEGGGVHLRGGSRVGKTTALRVAASVWGGEPGGGAARYLRQWRATSNGMEGVAAAHSDTLLALDELGQADPRDVGDVAYMLANGQGKARAERGGKLRASARFRSLFLSSGELALGDKIAESGRSVKAGQEVRLVDIPADAGAGLGLFEHLHGAAGAGAFTQALAESTGRLYGTAAPAFLRHLVARAEAEPDLASELRRWLDDLVQGWMATRPEAGGQVRSVARRFALIAIGGELATVAGVTGWDPNEATEAAGACLDAWLAERGTTGAREDAQAVAQLRDFLSLHGQARFEVWPERPPLLDLAHADRDPDKPPREVFRAMNRAGLRRWIGEPGDPPVWRFYLTPDALGEALAGLDKRAAVKVLAARGFLRPGTDGRGSKSFAVPGYGQLRLYEVRGAILDAAEGAD